MHASIRSFISVCGLCLKKNGDEECRVGALTVSMDSTVGGRVLVFTGSEYSLDRGHNYFVVVL